MRDEGQMRQSRGMDTPSGAGPDRRAAWAVRTEGGMRRHVREPARRAGRSHSARRSVARPHPLACPREIAVGGGREPDCLAAHDGGVADPLELKRIAFAP